METAAADIDGLDEARKDAARVAADGSGLQAPITGVEVRRVRTHADERGTLTEIYDERWGFSDDPLVYAYFVTVRPGHVRGWAMHLEQNDRLFLHTGVLRIVLYDGRTDSDTYGRPS